MERDNIEVQKFYKSNLWHKIQKAYKIYQHGICERCGNVGIIVHHKQHITSENIFNSDITMNFDNLELLCRSCHNKEHLTKYKDYTKFDNNGNVIVESHSIMDLIGIYKK